MKLSDYEKKFIAPDELKKLGSSLIKRIGAPISNRILDDLNKFHSINQVNKQFNGLDVTFTFWAASPDSAICLDKLPQKLEYDGLDSDSPEISVTVHFSKTIVVPHGATINYRYSTPEFDWEALQNATDLYYKLTSLIQSHTIELEKLSNKEER